MSQRIKTYHLIVLFLFCFVNTGNALRIYAVPINEPKLNVVIIDPGHGGKDWGTSVNGLKEKDLVLDIGLLLGKYIKEAYPDIKVIFTRDKDVFIPLNERAAIANKNKAGLFISIHANYVGVKSVSGTETFVLGNHRSEENLDIAKKENAVILLEDNYTTTYKGFDPNSSESYIMFETVQSEYLGQSLQFASFIQNQFKNVAKRADRGVKQAGFLVLRETIMPSVLIETGFISNEKERVYMGSESGKTNLATAVFKAFCDYKNIIEDKSSFNMNSETLAAKENSDSSELIKNVGDKSDLNAIDNSKLPENNPNGEISKNKVKDLRSDSSIVNAGELANNKKELTNYDENIRAKSSIENSRDSLISSKNEIKKLSTNLETTPTVAKEKGLKSGNTKDPVIFFTVQVAVTTNQVKLIPDNFKGEDGIFKIKIGTNYKYYKGKFDNYDMAASEKARLRNKFNDAFIVAFENGLPIPIKEAIQKTNN